MCSVISSFEGLRGQLFCIACFSLYYNKMELPICGRLKLNSDGCAEGNPGESEGGNLLRNDQGVIV